MANAIPKAAIAAAATIVMAFHRQLVIPPFILLIFSMVSISYALSDHEILLEFKSSLTNHTDLKNWRNDSKPVCNGKHANWIGVFCENGTVWGLKLENMGLSGTIDTNALSELRTLSFMNNNFYGPITKFNNLTRLRSLYLSYNRFSGHIPGNAFQGMVRLTKLYLSKNRFTGRIPASVATLPINLLKS